MERQQFRVLTYDLIKSEPDTISDDVTTLLNRIEQGGFEILNVQSTAIAGTGFSHMHGVMPQLVVTIHFARQPTPRVEP